MTARQETRFLCDRCMTDEVCPTDNSGPVVNRMAGPETWTMLRIGSAPDMPPAHLCPVCSKLFNAFMQGEKTSK